MFSIEPTPILSLVSDASRKLAEYFQNVTAENKADGSIVTQADRAAEAILVQGLSALFPDHTVISEEGNNHHSSKTTMTWYVDPLDGTSSFVEGLAHWGISLALYDGSEFCFGLTHFPRLNETYILERGQPLLRNQLVLPPIPVKPLSSNSVLLVPSTLHKYAHLNWPGKIRSLGSISSHLSLVASGSAVATVIPTGWQMWDIGAALPFARNQGLIARCINGDLFVPTKHPNSSFVVGNNCVMDWLQKPESVRFISTPPL